MEFTTSEKIQILLRKKSISIATLAEHLNCSQQNIYAKLRRNNWNENDLKQIAIFLGCTVETVFTDQTTGEKL